VKESRDTAILLFSESPRTLAGKKHFDYSADKSFQLAKGLHDKSFNTVKKSGFSYVHIDENAQHGRNFGAKLANALEEVFGLGYEKVIVVGNDCPDLTVADIQLANWQLAIKGGLVLGPDLRGGTYLLGISKESFDYRKFVSLPWESSKLRHSFSDYSELLNVSLYWLNAKSDFNTKEEIESYWSVSAAIRKLVNKISKDVTIECWFTALYVILFQCQSRRRGPPKMA